MPETKVLEPMFGLTSGVERFLALCSQNNTALTYNDVLLVPQFSELNSRKDTSLSTSLFYRKLDNPIIAANMDTICESRMAIAMRNNGGCGVIHRYMSNEQQLTEVSLVNSHPEIKNVVAVAVGIAKADHNHIINLIEQGANTLVIDVAHGHHIKVRDLISWIRDQDFVASDALPVEIVAGNVATSEGVKFLVEAGAHTVKIGIGPGSVCTTRTVTGHGVPQLYALAIAKEFHAMNRTDFKIIADGGINNSGDIVKALACGADAVMVGRILAGTEETPGLSFMYDHKSCKVYRGMASGPAQDKFYGNGVKSPEGIAISVPYKGPVKGILKPLLEGIRSGLSYSGAVSIETLTDKADWLKISEVGLKESLTQ